MAGMTESSVPHVLKRDGPFLSMRKDLTWSLVMRTSASKPIFLLATTSIMHLASEDWDPAAQQFNEFANHG